MTSVVRVQLFETAAMKCREGLGLGLEKVHSTHSRIDGLLTKEEADLTPICLAGPKLQQL